MQFIDQVNQSYVMRKMRLRGEEMDKNNVHWEGGREREKVGRGFKGKKTRM